MTIFLIIITVVWFLFMTYLSHQDGAHTSIFSWRIAERLSNESSQEKVDLLNGKLRKIAHIAVFFVLMLLVNLTLISANAWKWYWVAIICFWAWGDEATKIGIEGRHFSWYDVGLNLIGVGIGCIIMLLYGYWLI